MKVAIVGSQGKHWTPSQRTKVIKKIKEIFLKHADMEMEKVVPETLKPTTFWNPYAHLSRVILISGGCGSISKDALQNFDGGIDVWAEIVADVLGVLKDIKYPKAHTKHFFEQRNREIAEDCDILYCLDPAWRSWSGGQWTAQMARKLGKEVHLVLIK